MNYISIHNHTIFSFLDGMISPKELVQKASSFGMKGVGLTDHGNITGAIEFYKACKEEKINPIIGVEAYFVDDVEKKYKEEKKYHIVILAKSEKGLKSLFKLLSIANENIYYKPRIDKNILFSYGEDLIISTACMKGILSHPNKGKILKQIRERFDLYLEIMPLGLPEQQEINKDAVFYSKQYDIPLIATNDTHYLNIGDDKYHNFLLKMNTKGRFEFGVSGMYLKSYEQLKVTFARECSYLNEYIVEQAIDNTNEINDKVNIDLQKKDIVLPDIGNGQAKELLSERVYDRLEERFPNNDKYKERIKLELQAIQSQNYSEYFILISDFIEHCKENKIRLGYGRGSAAGSLVCYLLDITGVDPIKEHLLFERFINKDRIDYPDIDLDVPQSKRQKAVKYFKNTFGNDRVANVGTIAKLHPKSAFKDVAREYRIPFNDANLITKHIDNDLTIQESYTKNSILRGLIASLKNGEALLEIANAISGTFRQAGTHAAGIVISPDEITNYGVIERRNKEEILNWQKEDLDFFGLVKFDLLGLSALDKIADTEKLIEERYGEIDYNKVSDKEILKEFSLGNTVGIFQFETSALMSLLRRLNPITNKNMLIDANALNRPGPLDSGWTEQYIKRHHLELKNEQWIDDSEYSEYIYDITKYTKGIVIYQEQVMKILVDLAGYTYNQADNIRRIIGKSKGAEEFEKYKEEFVEGCKKTNNIDPEISTKLFESLKAFSRYGFNKSHSASYTELSWMQMKLKVGYPKEFMISLFKWTKEESKLKEFVQECNRLNIGIEMPNINKSQSDFALRNGNFIVGLESIKGIGKNSAKEIIQNRNSKPYKNLEDLRLRVSQKNLTKQALRNLVLCGACDEMQINKKAFVENEDWFTDFYNFSLYGKKKTVFDNKLPKGIYAQEQLSEEELLKFKYDLLPGIFSATIIPNIGLNLDFDRLARLDKYIRKCRKCYMYKYYNKPLPPNYTHKSDLFIIGEAPGEKEVKKEQFFIGKAGKNKLWPAFNKIGLSREDLYITNVYKCRPKGNKLGDNPPHDCWEILKKEIEVVQPKIIIAFGGSAKEFFTGDKTGIMKYSGTMHTEIVANRPIPVIYSIHPASLLYGEDENKKEIWQRTWEFIKETI